MSAISLRLKIKQHILTYLQFFKQVFKPIYDWHFSSSFSPPIQTNCLLRMYWMSTIWPKLVKPREVEEVTKNCLAMYGWQHPAHVNCTTYFSYCWITTQVTKRIKGIIYFMIWEWIQIILESNRVDQWCRLLLIC